MARLLSFASLGLVASAFAAAQPVDFATQIRPLLNQSCVPCHGGVKSAGEISFVYRDVVSAVGKKSGKRVIVPGQPAESELMARITSTDPEYRMPPADHGPALPPDKIALLRAWIAQGAGWQEHWAFTPPVAQAVPRGAGVSPASRKDAGGTPALRPIDAFVRARLAQEKLVPSAEAPRAALLRRASLDLIGLPPTPEEIAGFVADAAPNAFEQQVDRLLASPHFGERWASHWLDLARYADTKGYEADRERTVWPYRDWVIGALNRNLPYDRFLIEQLAGDLLPQATLEQQVATTFHRLTQVNDEGGTDDEEFRTVAVIDRVATTWQAAAAVTFNCVQCHSHPYDPIRQQEFYRFLAFFNNTRDADFNDELPTLRVPDDPARYPEVARLRTEIATLRHDVVSAGRALAADAQWRPQPILAARATPDATVHVRDGALEADGTLAANVRYELTLPVLALSGEPITAIRFEVPPDDAEKARHTPERGFIVNQLQVALSDASGNVTPVSVGRFFPDTENFTTITTKAVAKAESAGATLRVRPAQGPEPVEGVATADDTNPESRASSLPQSPTAPPAAPKQPAKKAAKGSAPKAGAPKAGAAKAGAMAPPTETRDITLDFHFAANPTLSRPRWIVAALREPLVAPAGATIHITVTHGRQISSKPAFARRLRVATSSDARWTALGRDAGLARKSARVSEAIAELARIPGTELPVMAELPSEERRETRLFHRGNFLEKTGAPLEPGVPALFPPLPAGAPANRLTLAQWFFQPGQPLTARAAVNRFWEQLFGTGLVATLEDFGSVGERPSHPELLDWLAVHFERDLKWDTKALLRAIVTSATYRQDATLRPELLERDPQNRLLARGPRQRLTAEMVRDQALAASGLLSRKMGGPPVMPPQPPGVWQTVYNNKDWVESKGEDRFRRGVYTFWKRSAAYPGFLTFDMTSRDLCSARRTPTNTPLQALVTLNDVVYFEAADALAARVGRELADSGVEARLARAFELVISRPPTAAEVARLKTLHDESRRAATAVTAGNAEKTGETSDHRAMRSVAVAILNLDAALVR